MPMTRVKAAINGGRTAPAVPITPQQIATETGNTFVAGAFAVHVHPRDAGGRESLAPDDVGAVVVAAGAVGVTTGAWIEPDAGKRLELIRQWRVLPAFASVNMNEEGAVDLAELLLDRGVAVEAGLATAQAAGVLIGSGVWRQALRVLLEPQEQDDAHALANVAAICDVLDRGKCDLPRLLHGVDATVWPLIAEAARRGWDTRAGFEDTLLMPDGSPAQSNAQLVQAARSLIARIQHG
jgi:uncharacterized protein (DUF849 family)